MHALCKSNIKLYVLGVSLVFFSFKKWYAINILRNGLIIDVLFNYFVLWALKRMYILQLNKLFEKLTTDWK